VLDWHFRISVGRWGWVGLGEGWTDKAACCLLARSDEFATQYDKALLPYWKTLR
jgi:hypothetical protein